METNTFNLGSSSPAGAMLQSSYTDLTGLQNIRSLGNKNQSAALKELSKQFESIFVHMMLKSMRDANAAFEEGSLFQSNEMEFYRDMMDNELALHLSQGRGIGLADKMYQQMLRQFEVDEQAEAAWDANLQLPQVSWSRPLRPAPVASVNEATDSNVQFENQRDFVETLLPHAQVAAQRLGLDPSVLLAQSALETGWGQHLIKKGSGESSFNLFNIKADGRWQGDQVAVTALEFRDGAMHPERSAFRSYQNFQESMHDYVEFVQSEGRYQNALQHGGNPETYIKALHEAGYATDPDYAEKVIRLLNSEEIRSRRSTDDSRR